MFFGMQFAIHDISPLRSVKTNLNAFFLTGEGYFFISNRMERSPE